MVSVLYEPTVVILGGGKRDIVGSLQARDYKGVGNQYVMENKLVVQQTPPSAT